MGVCGGAMCAGKYWKHLRTNEDLNVELFDFLIGVSLHYEANEPASECAIIVDRTSFQITGGAALAVHIEEDIASASSFPCGKNNTWYPWCAQATVAHQSVVNWLAKQRVSGPWWHHDVGTWYFSIRGVALAKM